DIIRVAQLIIETLSEPFFLSEKEANIGASIGIAVFPDDAVEQATLMNKADSAMYKAKQSGRNKYCFFE
ncbi:MAG: GGDEF domain-containing protein, partial [Desulfobulbaceae bacterium]|nr:GGDEF domain-containing protein [Desulfobulbaceae bacterium]